MKINELHEEGRVVLEALITKADQGKTPKNTPYLSLMLEDASGALDAKFWNLNEEQVKMYHPGQIVRVKGDLIHHRNAAQLRVFSMDILEGRSLMDFVRSAPISREVMEKEIDQTIAEMQNPIIQDVTREILEMKRTDFFSYPAAVRNHHNFAGGLAYHTCSMLEGAKRLAPLYPFLDTDLLYAGILLHDMGKIEEYTQAILPEYSVQGNLLGHISMMSGLIEKVASILEVEDSEEVMLLKHMVLSHHGKMEYGSPVLPMIPEAEMLHTLDNLDARMFMMKQSLDTTLPGTFGPRVFALDNRMIYHRKGLAETSESKEQSRKQDMPQAAAEQKDK